MQIAEGIETGRDYFWKRSKPWNWFDDGQRWWVYYVEFSGFNGGGGVWIVEKSKWNTSAEFMFENIRTLNHEKSLELIEDVQMHIAADAGREQP